MANKNVLAEGYSLAEEIANSISHGTGCIFGIVGLVLLLSGPSTLMRARWQLPATACMAAA